MGIAIAAAELITSNVRDRYGNPVECVMADITIGGVYEAAQCAEKFEREGVCASLSVTPCWCYGCETMDMDSVRPKAVWGFNGTERPGAVYLAAVLAAHTQKGRPAFGIYGRDVQDAGDTTIPEDVCKKILWFAISAVAVGEMLGKSYLSCGNVSMGIAGSIVNPDFFEKYLGMRCEQVDMSEFIRRIEEEIYDKEEYERALAWTREKCTAEGVIRLDGQDMEPFLQAILEFLPLDIYADDRVILMRNGAGEQMPPIWDRYREIIQGSEEAERFAGFAWLDRQAFYVRVRQSYAVIATGESAQYANIILKKA